MIALTAIPICSAKANFLSVLAHMGVWTDTLTNGFGQTSISQPRVPKLTA